MKFNFCQVKNEWLGQNINYYRLSIENTKMMKHCQILFYKKHPLWKGKEEQQEGVNIQWQKQHPKMRATKKITNIDQRTTYVLNPLFVAWNKSI
jgi:hypothetical protein